MPKSKVRKKPSSQASRSAAAAATSTTRAKAVAPSGPVYIGVMIGLMVLGLLWLVLYYLWGSSIPVISSLGNWNFGVGFALMIAGLLMTMGWR